MSEENIRGFLDYITEPSDFSAEEYLNEAYEPLKVDNVIFYPSRIVKELDPTLYYAICDNERQYWIDEWMWLVERHDGKYSGQTLYEFLDIEDCFKARLEDIIWKEEEEDEDTYPN